MSDFYNPHEDRTARKAHRCTYCAEPIAVCEHYVHQTGVYDGKWYTNKMHPECLAMHQADADKYGEREWEYSPYSHERPKVEA